MRDKGAAYEDVALSYLQRHGLELMERNYRTNRGEIDLIMRQDETVVFVEVRYRAPSRYGGGLESIDRKKRRRIVCAAEHYLQRTRLARHMNCRFDVVALNGPTPENLSWLPRAFTADDI